MIDHEQQGGVEALPPDGGGVPVLEAGGGAVGPLGEGALDDLIDGVVVPTRDEGAQREPGGELWLVRSRLEGDPMGCAGSGVGGDRASQAPVCRAASITRAMFR